MMFGGWVWADAASRLLLLLVWSLLVPEAAATVNGIGRRLVVVECRCKLVADDVDEHGSGLAKKSAQSVACVWRCFLLLLLLLLRGLVDLLPMALVATLAVALCCCSISLASSFSVVCGSTLFAVAGDDCVTANEGKQVLADECL